MLSLIKSKTKKQDGSRAGNGKLGKRSRSLISRPIEVLTSANLNKLQQQQKQQQQQQQNLQLYEQQQQLQVKTCQMCFIYSSIKPKYSITLYGKSKLLICWYYVNSTWDCFEFLRAWILKVIVHRYFVLFEFRTIG